MLGWFNISIIWGKYFNASNLFILCVGFLVLWNSFLSLRTDNDIDIQDSVEYSFYVVDERQTSFFETVYSISVDGQLWEVSNIDNFIVGSEYKSLLEVVEIYTASSENSFEVFQRSQGIRGEIIVNEEFLVQNSNCDIVCSSISFVRTARDNASYKASQFACHSIYPFTQWLYYDEVSCGDVSSLITGLVYGDDSGIDTSLQKSIQKFGLSHLTAVSGFQVALVASCIEVWFRRLRFGYNSRLILSITSLLFLLVFAGFEPPLLRSFFSICFIYLARFLGRRCGQIRALMYSSIVLLLINPLFLFSVSFQLSFLATVALLVTPFKRNFFNLVFTPVNAFFFTLPVIASFGEGVSWIGILANAVVSPFVAPVTYLSIIGFVPFIGDITLSLVVIILGLILNIIADFAPYIGVLEISAFSALELWLYYFVLIVLNKVLYNLIKTNKPAIN